MIIKISNIGIVLLLLALPACSLFQTTPDSVVAGQRAVYQGLILAEQNNDAILRRYEEDNKAAATYHINFVFEPKIDTIRRQPDLSKEEKSAQIAEIEAQRDHTLQEAFAAIEKIVSDMRTTSSQNLMVTKKLTESVYNYLSTSPIEIDNIDFWIEKLKQLAEK